MTKTRAQPHGNANDYSWLYVAEHWKAIKQWGVVHRKVHRGICRDPVSLQMWDLLGLNIWNDQSVLGIQTPPLSFRASVPMQVCSWSGHTAVRRALLWGQPALNHVACSYNNLLCTSRNKIDEAEHQLAEQKSPSCHRSWFRILPTTPLCWK